MLSPLKLYIGAKVLSCSLACGSELLLMTYNLPVVIYYIFHCYVCKQKQPVESSLNPESLAIQYIHGRQKHKFVCVTVC